MCKAAELDGMQAVGQVHSTIESVCAFKFIGHYQQEEPVPLRATLQKWFIKVFNEHVPDCLSLRAITPGMSSALKIKSH